MPLTQAPEDEAIDAIVARINAGTAYTLPSAAVAVEVPRNAAEDVSALSVFVYSDGEQKVSETLNPSEDRTLMVVRVGILKKVSDQASATLAPLKLIVAQISHWLNIYDSSRVKIWAVDAEFDKKPSPELLDQSKVFYATIAVRCTVEPA